MSKSTVFDLGPVMVGEVKRIATAATIALAVAEMAQGELAVTKTGKRIKVDFI